MQATYANLVGDDNTITFNCSGGVDANACVIDGWITDATHFITVNVAEANRHTGTGGTGYRIVGEFAYVSALEVSEPYTVVNGVAGGQLYDIVSNPILYFKSNVTARNCLAYSNNGGYGVRLFDAKLISSVVVDCDRYGIWITDMAANGYIYNCTVLNCGINESYPNGIYMDAFNTLYITNTYVGGATGDAYAKSATGTMTMATCHADDATGDTQTSVANCHFTNSSAGSENIHIDNTSSLRGVGTDLHTDAGYAFNTDFEDDTISNGDWCVGADWIAAATGGANIIPTIVHNLQIQGIL
jgi:hypothetical protein